MAVDGDNWVEALQAFRKRLTPFVREGRELARLFRCAEELACSAGFTGCMHDT